MGFRANTGTYGERVAVREACSFSVKSATENTTGFRGNIAVSFSSLTAIARPRARSGNKEYYGGGVFFLPRRAGATPVL